MKFGIYNNLHIINKDSDKSLKIKEVEGFSYAENLRSCAITITEFFEAAKSLPILFSLDDSFVGAVVLLGLNEEKNLLLMPDATWKPNEYIPAFVRRYPFIFVQNDDQLALAVDMDAPQVNKKSGKAIFNRKGEPSEYAETVMTFMETYQQDNQKTVQLLNQFKDLNLLEEANISINTDEDTFVLKGLHTINEEALSSLSNEQVLALVQSGAYKLIVAHLMSLTNLNKLASYSKDQ